MLEAGWTDVCDEVRIKHSNHAQIWVVEVDHSTAVERLQHRNGLSVEECEKRLQAQWSNEQRERFADRIIKNNGSLAELTRQIDSYLWSVCSTKQAISFCTAACPSD